MAPVAATPSVEPSPRSRCWTFASAVFDERTLELRVRGEIVDVERKPCEVLLHLLLHAGEVVTKDELLEAVWPRRILTETALTKCIARLREALGDIDQSIVKTIYGLGYRLVAPVHVEASVAPPTPHFDFNVGDNPPLRPHWKLLRRLGGGSHGEAWLARHEKTSEQRVFKFALDAPALISLKREITLFRLLNDTLDERAQVVRLLDWNLEQPPCFIEAEYIAGGSLADWIAQKGGFASIVPAQRVDLAAQIAEALAGTHSVGVLHKDLKPTNVLIDTDDAEHPLVRLGDFGSGGMLDPDRLDALHITRMGFTGTLHAGETSGTLTYLAPEVLAGQPSTVQTDIYALGVILYQLVVGDLHRPLAPGWERDVVDEQLREDIAAAADIDPSRRLGDAGELARRLRSLSERRRQRAEERSSVAAAARAQSEAQQAKQDAEKMRARRTGMRVALGVLLGALIVSSVLFVDAQRARGRAETETAHAKAVSDFLNDDVLTVVSSGDQPVKDLTVKQLLNAASQQADKRFVDQPDIGGDVDHSLGMSYYRLELPREAQERFEHGLSLLEQPGRKITPMTLNLAGNLVLLKLDAGQLTQAIGHYQDLLEQGEKQLGSRNPAVIDLRGQLAAGRNMLGEWVRAAAEYREVLADKQSATPDDLEAIASAHKDYGLVLIDVANFPTAESELHKAADGIAALHGENNVDVASVRWGLGKLMVQTGRYAEAKAELSSAAKTYAKWVRDDNGAVYGIRLYQAIIDVREGRVANAEESMSQIIAALGTWTTGEVDQTAIFRECLALAFERANRLPEAIDNMRAAVESSLKNMPETHPQTRRIQVELADLLRESGNFEAAGAIVDGESAVTFADLPNDHPLHAELLRVRGLLDLHAGNVDGAHQLLAEAARIDNAVYGPDHWQTQRVARELMTVSATAHR